MTWFNRDLCSRKSPNVGTSKLCSGNSMAASNVKQILSCFGLTELQVSITSARCWRMKKRWQRNVRFIGPIASNLCRWTWKCVTSGNVHSNAVLSIGALVFAVWLNIELSSASWVGSRSPLCWSAFRCKFLLRGAARTNCLRLSRGTAVRRNLQTRLDLSCYELKRCLGRNFWWTCSDLVCLKFTFQKWFYQPSP